MRYFCDYRRVGNSEGKNSIRAKVEKYVNKELKHEKEKNIGTDKMEKN